MYEKEVLEYLAGLELQQSTHIVICIQRYVPVSATSHKFCARRKYSIHIPVLIAIGDMKEAQPLPRGMALSRAMFVSLVFLVRCNEVCSCSNTMWLDV
jgi:hypothetical protein